MPWSARTVVRRECSRGVVSWSMWYFGLTPFLVVTHVLVVMLSCEPACPRARFGLGCVVRADARSSCRVKDPLDRRTAVDSLEAATRTSASTLRRTRDPYVAAIQKRNETFKSSASRTSGYMAGPRRLRKQGEVAGWHTASIAVCHQAFRPTVRPNRWSAMYPHRSHSTLSVAGSPS